jgi:branched-chain amino acid transport system ATP-binding protein
VSGAPVSPSPWLLEARGLTKCFGGLTAVKALNIEVARGALYGLIGPNGAGKTTVFNLLTGQYRPTQGEILFDGARIDGTKPYEIARRGIARTFQNIRLFADMTVLGNVLAAHHLRTRQILADAVLGTGRHHAEEQETLEQAMRLLKIGSRSRGRSRPGRACCSWTSRQPG